MSAAAIELGTTTARQASVPKADLIPNFERLLGTDAWMRLPPAVRARFAADAHMYDATLYVGDTCVRANAIGRVFAHLCRCIGTPVAPYVGEAVPLRVNVYRVADGVVWERRYAFTHGECVVRSTKQFDGDSLVEKLGAGLHMRLRVFEQAGALNFASAGYFFRVGGFTLRLPDWFLPGGTLVVHRDLGDGSFRFTMRTHHHWFGELFYQDGVFREGHSCAPAPAALGLLSIGLLSGGST